LPHHERFSMVVAFEGEKGNRHAHILAHIPQPRKKCKRSSGPTAPTA
jgi:hypothetical protein